MRRAVVCVVLAAAAAGAQAQAARASFVAVADATLIEEPTGALANGSGIRLFVGRVGSNAGNTLRRAVLRFDLSALPPGAIIESAALTLTLDRARQSGDLPVAVHRLTAGWAEGPTASSLGNGEPAVAGDVTWLHRQRPAALWLAAGGDFVATPSASRIVGSTAGFVTWTSTPQLVADVQSWLSEPASNHGWVILGFEGGGTSAKGFVARESTVPADRPTLAIEYRVGSEADIPVPAWALAALALGLGTLLGRRRRP